MRVIIEDYQYPAEKVDKVLWEGAFQSVDGMVSIGYVGYYWNEKLRESVFMLPKVLLNEKDRVFAPENNPDGGYAPEDSINVDNSPISKDERDFLYGFAVWIYRAIVVYKESHRNSSIILHRFVAQTGRGRKRLSNTMLDVILSLKDFLKRNQDFITFIAKTRHSGYNKVNWTKTVARKQPIFTKTMIPIYAEVVNRKKEVDRDEELLVIFHSIINYIHEKYGFEVKPNLNYELITGANFERYMRGYGAVRLRQIKYKYYSDKMLELWDLCYVFFNHSHRIALASDHKEYLLAKDFNIVFEAIIDELIGDADDEIVERLKNQPDGKLVDHMFSAQGLTNNDEPEHNVYYIGDSKYYKRGNKIGGESEAKQFTYARNVIQWNMNLFLDDGKTAWKKKFPKLRDDVTEGYNIIPNFFISSTVNEKLDYDKGDIKRREDTKFESRHFENRLFDRDTLLVAHYDINFLFIIALYARNSYSQKAHWKGEMREKFRSDIQAMLQKKFKFYAMTPLSNTDADSFFREHFQQLLGKVFTPYNDVHEKTTFYSLALVDAKNLPDGSPKEKAFKKAMLAENDNVLKCLGDAFEIAECPLGVDPSTKVTPHEAAPYVAVPAATLTRHFISNYLGDYFLFGCIKNDGGDHRDWVFTARGKYKRCAIYNVRLGDRPGAVKRSAGKVRTPKFVVMYEEADDKSYRVFRVHHAQAVKKERMDRMGYPRPSGDYFCYFLDEEVSLGDLDVHKIRKTYKYLLDSKHPFAPLYITGTQVAATM